MEINNNILSIIIIIFLIIIIFNSKIHKNTIEHLVPLSVQSNEGIQILGSIFGSHNAVLDNLTITGSFKLGDTVITPSNIVLGSNTKILGDIITHDIQANNISIS